MNTYTYHHCPEPAEFLDDDTEEAATHEPDRAPVIMLSARQVADLAELLDEVDQFLRTGEHSIDALTEFYRTRREDYHPRFTALCLLDSVSFTALCLRRQAQAAAIKAASDQEAEQ